MLSYWFNNLASALVSVMTWVRLTFPYLCRNTSVQGHMALHQCLQHQPSERGAEVYSQGLQTLPQRQDTQFKVYQRRWHREVHISSHSRWVVQSVWRGRFWCRCSVEDVIILSSNRQEGEKGQNETEEFSEKDRQAETVHEEDSQNHNFLWCFKLVVTALVIIFLCSKWNKVGEGECLHK